MRPLYDRYRAVKRLCSGGARERENSRVSMCQVTPRASNVGPSTSYSSTGDSFFLNDSVLQSAVVSACSYGDMTPFNHLQYYFWDKLAWEVIVYRSDFLSCRTHQNCRRQEMHCCL